MKCGQRTLALKAIATAFGLTSRIVHIYSDEHNRLASHTFLEVLNGLTRSWEIQDPDFNVYYQDRRNGRRLAAIDLVFGDKANIQPCSGEGNCGFERTKTDHLRDQFFEAVMYDARRQGKRPLLIINIDRFDIYKRFPDEGRRTIDSLLEGYRPVIMAYPEGARLRFTP